IINSITRFMTTRSRARRTANTMAMPNAMRRALVEMGRKGGKRNTPAQQAARAKGPQAATKARKHRTYQQARQAQHFRRQGHNRTQIAEKLGKSASTISRYLRRWLPLTEAEKRAGITGASGERYTLAPTTDTLHWTLSSCRPASESNHSAPRVMPPQYLRWSRRSTNPPHSI